MHNKMNTLIARALLIGLFSSFFAFSQEREVVAAPNASDNFPFSPQIPSNPPSIPQIAPPSAPPPTVAEAPPPANNEFVLQKAARN